MNSPTTAPTASPDPRNDEVVARLQQSDLFRTYQDAFQTATGLPLFLRSAGAFQAPMDGAQNISPFCALMASRRSTCAACLQLQQRVEGDAKMEARTLQCFAGLNDSLVPIRLGEKIVGYLQTGQVLFQQPTERQFRAAMKQLQLLDPTVNVAQMHDAYFATRVLVRDHYDAMLRLLSSFAQHLSLLSNELMITQATAEPPAVAKARAYIAEHLTSDLSLEEVARAANTSPFYFCKVFKAATGLTFTDYVARARIEKTKEMLLNPNTRISEAAYAVGFQSLSQFNRVFRRIVGEAPTTYRERHVTLAAPLAHAA